MEFPEDVLRLIRAFYQPCFREFQLFNRARKVLDEQCLDLDWSHLKKILQEDAEVVPILKTYVDAVLYRQEVRHKLHVHVTSVFRQTDYHERTRLVDLLWDSRHREHHLYRFLLKKIYGVTCYDVELRP